MIILCACDDLSTKNVMEATRENLAVVLHAANDLRVVKLNDFNNIRPI